jgi:hypothetical protein
MKNKKIFILVICLAVALTGCSFDLAKKNIKPIVPRIVENNVATTTEKIATTTETAIASSTDDMSNWKTYSNKDIGLEFKYPPTWPTIQVQDSFYINLPDSSIFTNAGYKNLYPKNMPNSEFGCPRQLGDKETCEVRISKNGARYVWDTTYSEIYGTDHNVFLSTGKSMVFFFFYSIENYNKRASEYEKLLSSLKIIK